MNASGETRGTVLIVDDDPAVLILIQRILTAADYRVLVAAERAGALCVAQQKHLSIDLALLDVCIPGVSGTQLADELLAIRPAIRVLWMSGFVDEEFIRVKLVDGYTTFLPKPLHRRDLLLAVQQALEAVPADGTPGHEGEGRLASGARA
jgi:two-component system cell cycle sensor histidine kinase/response regulator CckA